MNKFSEIENKIAMNELNAEQVFTQMQQLITTDKWISVDDRLPPKSKDDSVLVYWPGNGSIETVHIQDYFDEITNGFDSIGNQLYTRWYLSQGVTYWQPLPPPPK